MGFVKDRFGSYHDEELSPFIAKLRICNADDITQKIFETGNLYVCPPKDVIQMKDSFLQPVIQQMVLALRPANDSNETSKYISSLYLHRY